MGRHGGRRRLLSDRGLMVVSVWVAVLFGAGQLGVSVLALRGPAVLRVTVAAPSTPPGAAYWGGPPGRGEANGPTGPYGGLIAWGHRRGLL